MHPVEKLLLNDLTVSSIARGEWCKPVLWSVWKMAFSLPVALSRRLTSSQNNLAQQGFIHFDA
jgi:hypothetical protein